MKLVQSLLACIQLLAICQLIFGLMVVDAVSDGHDSSMATQFEVQERYVRMHVPDYRSGLWGNVQRWHRRTATITRRWCIISGGLLFAASTSVVYLLRSSNK
jgi:hypothetical protein